MSGKIVGEVMRYAPADLTIAQRFVLVALAESVRDRDGQRVSRTNTAAIAEGTCLAAGTVRNAIMELTRRALIAPFHDRARIGRGRLAQQYRIMQLEAHHRAVSGTPDSVGQSQCHSPVTLTPVDNSSANCQQAPNSVIASTPVVSLGSDTNRKDLPVTTVGRYLSKQVTVPGNTNKNGLPHSLRSVANGSTRP